MNAHKYNLGMGYRQATWRKIERRVAPRMTPRGYPTAGLACRVEQWKVAQGLPADGCVDPVTLETMLGTGVRGAWSARCITEDDLVQATATAYNKERDYTDAQWASIMTALFPCGGVSWGHAKSCSTFVVARIAWWQRRHHLTADGKVGPTTLAALLGSRGLPALLHPMPTTQARWGFDHLQDWPDVDPQWTKLVSGPSWVAGMLALLTSTNLVTGHVSRGPSSVTSLDTISLGVAHWHAANLEALLARYARDLPEGCQAAWGGPVDLANIRAKRGKMKLRGDLYGLAAGWKWLHEASPYREAAALVQTQEWLSSYVPKGRRIMDKMGWSPHLYNRNGGLILAACTRLGNSGAAGRRLRKARSLLPHGEHPLTVLSVCYNGARDDGLYNHPDRWARLTEDFRFKGPAPQLAAAADLTEGGHCV